jgi:hypothetical protein
MVSTEFKKPKDFIEMQEKELTNEELMENYYDIKQAAQVLNNVSTKTARKYISDTSNKHSVNVTELDIKKNGGTAKLYLKKDIENIAKLLKKDNVVLVQVPTQGTNESDGDPDLSVRDGERLSEGNSTSFQEHSKGFQGSSQSIPTGSTGFQGPSHSSSTALMTNKHFATTLNSLAIITQKLVDLEEQRQEKASKKTTPIWKIILIYLISFSLIGLLGLGGFYIFLQTSDLIKENKASFQKMEEEKVNRIIKGFKSAVSEIKSSDFEKKINQNIEYKSLSIE